MKHVLSLIIFLFSSEIIAQQFTISGVIVDEQNNAIPYANVLLFDNEETIITGTTSLENGSFSFDNFETNTYTLKVSYIGFEAFTETFQLSSNKTFKAIVLKENSQTLGEVTITATKPTLKKQADRLVFNVANSALSEGNILEVLKSTPGVLILGDAITVKNSTPSVYINDKKVNLSAGEITQLLENSPANTIKKVEVITNPPAKYDAESGTVLNIVMSRNLITGYRGNVFSNYTQGVFPRYNTGINQFYKTKKINLNLNYSFTKSKINRENYDRVNYLDNSGNLNQRWQTINDRNTTSNTHNVNLNFDYFIDDSSTLSFSSNALLVPDFDYRINGKTLVTDNSNQELFNFNSLNHSQDDKNNIGFDLDFVHKFKNKGKLATNIHYTNYDYQRNQSVNSDYFLPNSVNNFSTAFLTDSNQDTEIFTSQLDYTLPLNESSDLALGLKTSIIETSSNISQFDVNQNTGALDFNTANSNAYDYNEDIFAAYASYNKSWDKWSFTGGLRVEQTNVDGLSVADNIINTQDYFEVFPTLNLSHQLSENTSIYTNYKRSISRPSYQLLNPFNFFLNDNTVVTGNPLLLPTFTNKYLLGTGLYDFLTVEIFYKANTDAIYEVPIQDNNTNIIAFTPTNINTSNEYGLDIEFYYNLSNRWFLYLANSLSNTDETLIVDNTEINLGRWYNYSIFSTDYSFLKDNSLSVNLAMTRVGKNINGLQTFEAVLFSDLSIKKTLLNKKATVSLAVSDIFNQQDYGITNRYNLQDSFSFTDQDKRYIKLGFSYKFGNTTLETNERTKELKERDRLEK
ncbi:outer membrane beta-barrel family protein [Lacinutrix sp.]|uniref:TonB-dependent receptor domain-containing protein n=1 Tax=Lacinutrix sp. TaxID=1937692 RepID=UPI0025BCA7C9|nr:outer membrane beta-barrel family protein [Lacinutrix sp.]